MPHHSEETIEVTSSPRLKRVIKRPKPPAGASLINWLAIVASALSILASTVRLMETITPELYLQLALAFWQTILLIVIAVLRIL